MVSEGIHHHVKRLAAYEDQHGNSVVIEDPATVGNPACQLVFRGTGNRVVIKNGAAVGQLKVVFEGDNGLFSLGAAATDTHSSWDVHIGRAASVSVGHRVVTENTCRVVAQAESTVFLAEDSKISPDCEIHAGGQTLLIRSDTGHPVNAVPDVRIGRGVHLESEVLICGGVSIGEGTVVMRRSVVRESVGSFVVVAGNPAVRRFENVTWEERKDSRRARGASGSNNLAHSLSPR